MSMFSGKQMEFNVSPERNSVRMTKDGFTKHRNLYYKTLVLKNWRCPTNDLKMVLTSQILNQLGFETLKF